MLDQAIADIVRRLRKGEYANEAAISQGVVMRLIEALGWPRWDPGIVKPEYPLGAKRVDYALCHPPNKPVILIEVKCPGHALDGERQLFEYAFHSGIPMAILTDGQEWHFYLPAGQGDYKERKVYNLNLLERDTSECVHRLKRYLEYQEVISGNALENARRDYVSEMKKREVRRHIPKAWADLVEERDDILIGLVQERVESMCGYEPDEDVVGDFLDRLSSPPAEVPKSFAASREASRKKPTENTHYGFSIRGEFHPAKNAIGAMIDLLRFFANTDPSFLNRFASRKHGRTRRYVATNKMDLYPDRPDLCEEYSKEFVPGWWVGTNFSRASIRKVISLACEVMEMQLGKDIDVHLGD